MRHFLFYTRTDVYSAEELLQAADIPYRILPTPDRMGIFCGLCIGISEENVNKAEKALQIKLYKLV